MELSKWRPSPGTVLGLLALVVAVAGTAIAGPLATTSVLTKKEKKQVRKIAKGQANKKITKRAPGLSVASAQNATNSDMLDGLDSSAFLPAGASIPSGRTITGAFGDLGGPSNAGPLQREVISFPAPAPANLTDAQINFAPSAAGGDDDGTCTGSATNPTAPAGKVCLYPTGSYTGAQDGSGQGFVVLGTDGTPASRHGFLVASTGQVGQSAGFVGVWAYTAP